MKSTRTRNSQRRHSPGDIGGGTVINNYVYIGTYTTVKRRAKGKGIVVCEVMDDDRWRELQVIGDIENPSFLVLDTAREHVYTAQGDGSRVSCLRIDRENGRLQQLGDTDCGGTNPVHLAVDSRRSMLVVANYGNGTIGRIGIAEDGALGALEQLVSLPGDPGPYRDQQPNSRPHGVLFDHSERRLFIADKGLDALFVYDVDLDGPRLSDEPAAICQLRSGSGPRHVVQHPALPLLYVVNELSRSLAVVRIDEATSQLTPIYDCPAISPSYVGEAIAAEIVLDPRGRWLYVSVRGSDTVAHFTLDPESGLPTQPAWTPSGGAWPRFMTADFLSGHLYVANEQSGTVYAFPINSNDGALGVGRLQFEVDNAASILLA